MTDEINVGGKRYILSRRAAEMSGYSQDYIGQLARGGHIDAQRIGGLWYVEMESLLNYKKDSDNQKPEPPKPSIQQDPDTLVFFDGKEFISASRASKLSGYAQDYVGQLARSGKVLSRQVGTRWYVDREALLEHKKEKDALLAAVQANAVGIRRNEPQPLEEAANPSERPLGLHFNYAPEHADLLPRLSENPSLEEDRTKPEEEIHAIPIHIVRRESSVRHQTAPQSEISKTPSRLWQYRTGVAPKLLAVLSLTLILGVSSLIAFRGIAGSFAGNPAKNESFAVVSGALGGLDGVTAMLERLLVPEIIYRRSR
ncbi:hypothetical protein C4556_02015 [Candidatus Parcubacteria bacterium]|nr:MAG: hypothetical protein C4556_02015 [Candidatus Parcubacteria bacterium]